MGHLLDRMNSSISATSWLLTLYLGSGVSNAIGEGRLALLARAAELAPFERDPPLALYYSGHKCHKYFKEAA